MTFLYQANLNHKPNIKCCLAFNNKSMDFENNKFKNLMKKNAKLKKNILFKKLSFFIFEIIIYSLMINNQIHKIVFSHNKIKISLCTMGKNENLYAKEFVEYYIKLGIDHIFIYDDNEKNTEKISNILGRKYKNKVTIYENIRDKIRSQSSAFTNCYHNNLNKYDWFLMVDMDEYLFIINNTLKNYLSNKIFNKCDFIQIHWVLPNDNNLVHYDPRPLFKRFRGPYMKSKIIKSIIRGNIEDLKYAIHSPFLSPKKNTTCNNEGKIIFSQKVRFLFYQPINIKKAYIIHFRFKTTEEFIQKYKRGYKKWVRGGFFKQLISLFFTINKITIKKINYFLSIVDLICLALFLIIINFSNI